MLIFEIRGEKGRKEGGKEGERKGMGGRERLT